MSLLEHIHSGPEPKNGILGSGCWAVKDKHTLGYMNQQMQFNPEGMPVARHGCGAGAYANGCGMPPNSDVGLCRKHYREILGRDPWEDAS